jgi:hypothetical protein
MNSMQTLRSTPAERWRQERNHSAQLEGPMKKAVYCLAHSEEQADEILTHLRNLDFRSSEVSILLKTT